MLPNPSLALQASMAREVSFPNGASTSGGPTKLKLQRRGNHGESEIDGAVTVRERDLITDRIPIDFVNQSASRSPGHIISWVCRIPLPHGHGSVRVASEDHRRGNP